MGAGCELGELQRHWHLIEPKIPLCEDGTRKNARLEAVRSRQLEVSAKRSGAADARWEAHANASANAHAKTMQRKVKVEGEVEREEGRVKQRDERFEAWYAAYPVKKSRGYAESAWAKLTTTERDQCLPAITAQVKACNFRGTDGKDYVPHPATWLNGRRWEDEVSTAPPPTPPAHEMTLREAIAECERIRAANGIAPGAYLPTHLIPVHVSKAMHRG